LGATYGFYAGVESYTREHRMLEMSGEVETEKLQAALDEIETTYTKFLQSGIGRIEFPIAKRFFSQESKKGLSNPVNVAFSVIDATKNGFSTDYVHKSRHCGFVSELRQPSESDHLSRRECGGGCLCYFRN